MERISVGKLGASQGVYAASYLTPSAALFGGVDGKLRWLRAEAGAVPQLQSAPVLLSADCALTAWSASLVGDAVVAGFEDHSVRLYSVVHSSGAEEAQQQQQKEGAGEQQQQEDCGVSLVLDKYVTKFRLAPSCVAFNASATLVACGSQDGSIKVVNSSTSSSFKLKEGAHAGTVLHVSFSPNGEQLVSTGSDGALRVWNAATLELHKEIAADQLPVLGNAERDGKQPLLQCSWSASGEVLAVPCKDGRIRMYHARRDYMLLSVLYRDGHDRRASVVAISRNGAYVASSAERELIVWHVASGEAVSARRLENPVTSLQWHETRNELLVSCCGGEVGFWHGAVEGVGASDRPHPCEQVAHDANVSAVQQITDLKHLFADEAVEASAEDAKSGDVASSAAPAVSDNASMELVEEDDVEEQQGGGSGGEANDNDAAKDKGARRLKRVAFTDGTAAGDDDDDDLDVLFDDPALQHNAPVAGDVGEAAGMPGAASLSSVDVAQYGLRALQETFQPATTNPMSESRRRLLAWNRFGRVVTVMDGLETVVEVNFADSSQARSRKLRVTAHFLYDMGALSSSGVALAASTGDDFNARAAVHYKPVRGLSGAAEFQQVLEEGENVLGVAMGSNWVAAVVAPYMQLKVWGVSSLQEMPLQLPISSFIAMVGDGPRLAVFHDTVLGPQLLLYNVVHKRLELSSAAPVTEGAVMTWCGFTPSLSLVTVDSAGVVRMLVTGEQWREQWVIISQPEGTPDLSRKWPLGWPISSTDNALIVVRLTEEEEFELGLVLDEDNRGAPLIDTIPYSLPLYETGEARTALLENVMRTKLVLGQTRPVSGDALRLKKEREVEKEIARVISLSVKAGSTAQATAMFKWLKVDAARMIVINWCYSHSYDSVAAAFEGLRQQALAQERQAMVMGDAAHSEELADSSSSSASSSASSESSSASEEDVQKDGQDEASNEVESDDDGEEESDEEEEQQEQEDDDSAYSKGNKRSRVESAALQRPPTVSPSSKRTRDGTKSSLPVALYASDEEEGGVEPVVQRGKAKKARVNAASSSGAAKKRMQSGRASANPFGSKRSAKQRKRRDSDGAKLVRRSSSSVFAALNAIEMMGE